MNVKSAPYLCPKRRMRHLTESSFKDGLESVIFVPSAEVTRLINVGS